LRQMAEVRLADAKVLLDGGRWEFAYYAAGYAVECGLKSCVLSQMIYTGLVFEEKVVDFRIHEFDKLVKLAGLKDEQNAEFKASSVAGNEFNQNWEIVKNWTSSSRYEGKSELEAKELYAAIADESHGVLRWIRTYW
jgi:HEPN domain-containing protein